MSHVINVPLLPEIVLPVQTSLEVTLPIVYVKMVIISMAKLYALPVLLFVSHAVRLLTIAPNVPTLKKSLPIVLKML